MNRITVFCCAVLTLLGTACSTDRTHYYIKEVTFPADADEATKIEMASRLVPSDKQLAWQDLELTAFLHYGINTYTDREWGDGQESPALFNPDSLDTNQWVKTLSDAGFKMVILTAKHHDGFCLWPTSTTSHSVASSPWKEGKGDVVRDLRASCDKYGMKMGVYLSPWDRNAECYGDSPRYNDMFVAQLTELLSNYGRIDEVWFDGACGEGPNGKKQEYDWTRFKNTIAELQPDAVVAIMGDDVRWVGNEKGLGRETEWSATALTPGIYPDAEESNTKLGLFAKAPDLGGRDIVAKADKLYWWPSEVDVSIRPGWFYHETENPKPLAKLADIYLNSVGRNSVLLLNVPPDTHGRINAKDAKRLMELRHWIDTNFDGNLITAGNRNLTYGFDGTATVNTVVLEENISHGQRIEEFAVMAHTGDEWRKVADGTTVGHKRIITFPDVVADGIRIDILSSRATPEVEVSGAYRITMPQEAAAGLSGYTVVPGTAITAIPAGASAAFDGDKATTWISDQGTMAITADLGKTTDIAGIIYTPRQDDSKDGTMFKYRLLASDDGTNWNEVPVSGEFSNIVNNPIPQIVLLPTPAKARFVKLECQQEVDGRQYISVAELAILASAR